MVSGCSITIFISLIYIFLYLYPTASDDSNQWIIGYTRLRDLAARQLGQIKCWKTLSFPALFLLLLKGALERACRDGQEAQG